MYDALHRKLFQETVLHGDETTLQVLKEAGRTSTSKSYMWLYRTGKDGKAPIILFDYQPSRSGEHAAAYLKDFKGYVHSDGYSGYNKLKEITRCGCWAHLRRKFVEALPPGKATGGERSAAETGFSQSKMIFGISVPKSDTNSVLNGKSRFLMLFGRGLKQ